MYGLIGRMTAVAGERDALIGILIAGSSGLPGCFSYVVAKDPHDENVIWVTEVWDAQASHHASLKLAQVQDAVAKGRPLILEINAVAATEPIGGFGL